MYWYSLSVSQSVGSGNQSAICKRVLVAGCLLSMLCCIVVALCARLWMRIFAAAKAGGVLPFCWLLFKCSARRQQLQMKWHRCLTDDAPNVPFPAAANRKGAGAKSRCLACRLAAGGFVLSSRLVSSALDSSFRHLLALYYMELI